jgi:rod shape-determining protein MreD
MPIPIRKAPMAEVIRTRRLVWQVLFAALAVLIAFAQLLPLSPGSGGFPGPDLLVLIAFAWVLRRPAYVPVGLVAVVALLADFLFMRPPGLWAALTVLGLELLRGREQGLRDLPFLMEWALVAALIAAMTLGQALVLLILMVNQPPLGLTLLQSIVTIAAYPVVVALTVFAFGLRRAAPGEVDDMGRRL